MNVKELRDHLKDNFDDIRKERVTAAIDSSISGNLSDVFEQYHLTAVLLDEKQQYDAGSLLESVKGWVQQLVNAGFDVALHDMFVIVKPTWLEEERETILRQTLHIYLLRYYR